LGLSGGYAQTSLSVEDRSSSGHSTSIQTGLYAGYNPAPWFVNGSLAYTSANNDMSRLIQFTGVSEQADSSFQSRVYTTFVQGGYGWEPRTNLRVEPALSLRQSHFHQEAFTEYGAPGSDLSVGDETLDSFMSA